MTQPDERFNTMFNGAVGIWNLVRGAAANDIRRQMELPVNVILVGSEAQNLSLAERLGVKNAVHVQPGPADLQDQSALVFDSDRLATLDDAQFDLEMNKVAASSRKRRIAVALAVPKLRPAVVQQISHDRAIENGRVAAISALPGVIPLTDWLMPATAAGDLLVLTRNQIMLLLEIAACYGRSPDPKARIKELLPIIGSAFGWRTVARELVGLVPGGIGVIVKAAIAYAGTYSVGRAAQYYYSGGTAKLTAQQMRSFYRGTLTDGFSRAKALLSKPAKV